MTKLQEIANPAAVAWEWTDTYDEFPDQVYRHQLVWPRGTWSMQYGTSVNGRPWTTTSVLCPERFGIDGTLKGARKAAQTFLSAAEDTQPTGR